MKKSKIYLACKARALKIQVQSVASSRTLPVDFLTHPPSLYIKKHPAVTTSVCFCIVALYMLQQPKIQIL